MGTTYICNYCIVGLNYVYQGLYIARMRCSHLHHSHLCAGMLQILCHLQTDESTSHNDCTPHLVVVHVTFDAVSVAHVSQREDSFAVDAGERWHHWRRSRREQQLVVAFAIFLAVGGAHSHFSGCRVYRRHFVPGAHVDIETLAESFWSLHKQAVAAFYHSTDIIWQSAVGV